MEIGIIVLKHKYNCSIYFWTTPKDKNIPKHLQMKDSLKIIKQQPKEIWMVKLADRITNLQPPPHYWTKEKIIHYHEEALKIYEELKDASKFLSGRFLKKLDDYHVYMK